MAVVQSTGQLVAVDRGWSPSISGARSVELFGGMIADYEAIYRTQPAVRTVISFLARNTAQLKIHGYRRVSDTDRQRLDRGHLLAGTLARPNPFMTRYRLMYSLISDRCIYDMALWVKFRAADNSGRVALIRIPPRKVTPLGDSWLDPEAFEIKGSRGTITVPRDSVVYFHGYNPDDARIGLSPMETLRQTIAEEHAATSYRANFWSKGARLQHVITRPEKAKVLSPEAKDRFWARWNAMYSGMENDAKTALLEEGMDIKPLDVPTARDAQYLEARKFHLEEVARFWHVPLPMVGILDNANFSNMQEAHKQLYQDTLGPDLTDVEEELELQLVPEFGDVDDVYLEFNIAEKLKGSFEEQATSLQTMVGAPIMTRNEGRGRLNLGRIDDAQADQLVTPLNVLIGGQASPRDTAPGTRSRAAKALPPAGTKSIGLGDGAPSDVLPTYVDLHEQQLTQFLSDLGDEILAAYDDAAPAKARGAKATTLDVEDLLDVAEATGQLAALLDALGIGVASAAGEAIADAFGADFDVTQLMAWLTVNATKAAENIVQTTVNGLTEALGSDAPRNNILNMFGERTPARARQLARARVDLLGNFGAHEGAKQAGVTKKTWRTSSANPRPSHARLNGETVALGEDFSNGGRWPHDHRIGDVDEIAGCTCRLTFTAEVIP